MALAPRLDLRQTQSLVMTPQLQQAIKLLALSNLEIEGFITERLESNPLLEIGEAQHEYGGDGRADTTQIIEYDSTTSHDGEAALDIAHHALDPEATPGDMGDWGRAARGSGSGGGQSDFEGYDFENHSAEQPTLCEHLLGQIGTLTHDPRDALIASRIIHELDETGYLRSDLRLLAEELGASLDEVERCLAYVQSLDPTGIAARNIAECLALQAKEADRYDPCMARLIDNLDLLAKGEFARLKRLCDVDDEDFADMLAELKGYDPKPGCRYGGENAPSIIPDVLVTPNRKGGWTIRINEASLPRLVVNREYYINLETGTHDKASRKWLNDQLSEADWLIRALDQRQKTILKAASEIVKRQEGFLREGISAMRPLTLREVAEVVDMHESTISRVTSNKYLACSRGTFELKYFFSSGVATGDGGAASNQAIKARIRTLCDAEDPRKVLSDQKLADLLNKEGFDLARRTVAKYRESINIGSSAERRRQKKFRNLHDSG